MLYTCFCVSFKLFHKRGSLPPTGKLQAHDEFGLEDVAERVDIDLRGVAVGDKKLLGLGVECGNLC